MWAVAKGWGSHSSRRNGSTGASLGIVSKLCFHGWRAYCQAGTIESTFLRLEAWPLLGGYPVLCGRVRLRILGTLKVELSSWVPIFTAGFTPHPKHPASEPLALSTPPESGVSPSHPHGFRLSLKANELLLSHQPSLWSAFSVRLSWPKIHKLC